MEFAHQDGDKTPAVTVIIATMAAPNRAASLRRAVASIRTSSALPVNIIVVINGQRKDPATVRWLFEQPDVIVDCLPAPSLTEAIRRGRELVETPYFSFLDDDDEYLPGGTDAKRFLLEASGEDVIVTNGYRRHDDGTDSLFFWRFTRVDLDPFETLMNFGWLNSANALYRTASIGVDFFSDSQPYGEWTWLAFRLAQQGKTIHATRLRTFRIHDTPDSLSKSKAYEKAYLDLYNRMMAADVPKHIRHLIRRKRSAFWHDSACSLLADGKRAKAMRAHLRSMCEGGGWRYLPFTRHLLFTPRSLTVVLMVGLIA
ncbi:hypothetical protein RD110_05560 [Rhodoferax koreense]|uniref:Glycosyltransferase 2-like domain-containing protein n=1 Tax=Rhodoferax koreensis TaxID=1842727 RepID=A0A1P8JSI1_9BURK|nr:glycosyltransferase [Rhodoferax koreense]APW36723.1 hypothetical protein RD110_05560 [Rhodoferax koreense]